MKKSRILFLLSVCFLGIASCEVKPVPSEEVRPNPQDFVETVDYFQITFLNGNGTKLFNQNLPKGYDLQKIANTLFPTQDSDGDYDYHFTEWSPKPTVVEKATIFRPKFQQAKRDTFTYEINANQTEYTIASYNLESALEVTIPDTYKNVPVTGIKANAFKQKANLKKVNLGKNIKTIGQYAFDGCSALTNIIYPKDSALQTIDAYAFYNCRKLKEILLKDSTDVENKLTFPNTLKTIGASAFEGCAEMTAIEIPKSVTSIGLKTVRGCTSLTSIVVDGSNATYSSLSSNVIAKKSGGVVIAGCKTSLFTSTSMVEIADYVFDGVSFVTINHNDPTNFTTNKEIALPTSVTKIGNYAFSNNATLERFTITGKLTKFDQTSLEGCVNLRFLSITGESPDFQTSNNCLIRKANTANATLPEGYQMPYIVCGTMGMTNFPNGMKGIGYRAFYRTKIETVNFPTTEENNKIVFLGDEIFRECAELKTLNMYLPSMLTDSAFPANTCRGCINLTQFTISRCFASMKQADDNSSTKGNGSFYDCSALSKIYINANLGNIPENTFTNCTAVRHVYFSGTEAQWKAKIKPESGSAAFKRGGNERVFGGDPNQFFHNDVTMHYGESGDF